MLIARKDEAALELPRISLARFVASDPSDDGESLIAAIDAVTGPCHAPTLPAAPSAPGALLSRRSPSRPTPSSAGRRTSRASCSGCPPWTGPPTPPDLGGNSANTR